MTRRSQMKPYINSDLIIINIMEVPSNLVILKEQHNDYQPQQQEIIDYADYLGFKFPEDQNLLWIAREGLQANLPSQWKACQNERKQMVYFNTKTGQLTQEHPLDEIYRKKFEFEKAKLNHQQLSDSMVQQQYEQLQAIHEQTESLISNSQLSKIQAIKTIENPSSQYQLKSPKLNEGSLTFAEFHNQRLHQQYSKKLVEDFRKIQLKIPVGSELNNHTAIRKQIEVLKNTLEQRSKYLQQLRVTRINKEKQMSKQHAQFQIQKQQLKSRYQQMIKQKIAQQKQEQKHRLRQEFEINKHRILY